MKVTRINMIDKTVAGFACNVFPFAASPGSSKSIVLTPESDEDESLLCAIVTQFTSVVELKDIDIAFTEHNLEKQE